MTKKRGLLTALAVLISVLHIVPFYILLTTSFKSDQDSSSSWAIPRSLFLGNFTNAWQQANLGKAFINDLIITFCSIAILIVIGSLAAYPLARYRTRWNRFIYGLFVAVLVVPPLTILVPLYKFIVDIGGLNTYWAIILIQVTFNLPITIFLYTGFIGTIPRDLDEASLIDGASRIVLFYRVIMPLLKPVTVTVIIITGVFIWNDYQFSVFFLQDPSVQTITVALSTFFSQFNNNIGWVAGGSLMASLPMIILFLYLQRHFIEGLSSGAVKG